MTIGRPGSQRLTCLTIWRAQSVSFLCRRPWLSWQRWDGHSAVRKGSAQTLAVQGMGAKSIMHSQRRPLTFTK